jgi:hypothetical protein
MIGDIFRLAQGGDCTLKVSGVLQDDRGDEQVEARGSVLLVLVGPVTDFTEPMNEDGTRQAVAGFPLVQLLPGLAPQFGILNPVEREERTLQPSQLSQCCRHAILPRIGSELPHDHRRGHGAAADGRNDTEDIRPVGADLGHIDPSGDEGFKGRIIGRFAEAVEAPVLQVRNAWCEQETQQAAQRKDMLGIAAAVRVVEADCNVALVIDQRVQHVERFARRRRNQLGEVRSVAAREVGVDLEPGSQTVMRIEVAGVTAKSSSLEELAIGR